MHYANKKMFSMPIHVNFTAQHRDNFVCSQGHSCTIAASGVRQIAKGNTF